MKIISKLFAIILIMVCIVGCSSVGSSSVGSESGNVGEKVTEKATEDEDSSDVTTEAKCEHSFSAATCTKAATCSKCGITNGDAQGHNYQAATCTEPKKCTKCGETSGSAQGHNYQAATCTEPQKCTKCGEISGSAKGHNYQAATCTQPQKCTQCGATQGNAAGHNYQAATCSTPQKCTRCGITNGGVTNHKFNSKGICTTCNKKITAKDLEGTINCRMIIPRNGTKNYYAEVNIGNASGAEMQISSYINFNGFGCDTFQGYYHLPTGYQITLPAYRALRVENIYDDKYCDMYLDNNSICHFVVTVYDQVFVIYCDVNGNTRIEKPSN